MEVRNLLDFLNNVKSLYVPDYVTCNAELVNFLDKVSLDEQFTQRIDAGLIYVHERSLGSYTLVDGLNRLISLSLLLHAICECYKKTSSRNDKAIKIIRKKYLFNGTKTKLKLPEMYQDIYSKIINGERLSGKEKRSPMFVLLHSLWTQIKEYKLHASEIFKMLQKINVVVVDVENIEIRDLYYSLNNQNRELNQLILVEDYLKNLNAADFWTELKSIYKDSEKDIILFFKDFFLSKFNYRTFDKNKLYEYFVNYFETMHKYLSADDIMKKMVHSAVLYSNMLNVNIDNENIKKAMIRLKMLNCEDTYAYLLSIYDDYASGTISESTFVEILETIEDYLKKRQVTQNNVTFNELIQYLNAFITYK